MHGDKNTTALVMARLQNKNSNALLDSGVGRSVIDMGSVEEIGMADKILPFPPDRSDLANASGEVMDMCGTVNIKVQVNGCESVDQKFEVLDLKTFSTVLLERDFLCKFGVARRDFSQIQLTMNSSLLNQSPK